MSSSITFLPVRLKRPWSNEKEDGKQVVVKSSARVTVHEKLATIRYKRVTNFFRAKARQRMGIQTLAGVVGTSSSAVMTMLQSLRRVVTGFFSRRRGLAALINPQSKWRKRLSLLPSLLTGERSLLSMAQRTLGRALANLPLGKAEKQAQVERQRRVRIYQWVCRSLARLGRSAIAAAHKRYRIEGAAKLARQTIDKLIDDQTHKVIAMCEQERRGGHARVVQRLWWRAKRNERASFEAKARLITLLTSVGSCLQQYEQTHQRMLESVHEASTHATAHFVLRAAQRLGARLIQRVWRGYSARQRVRRFRDWKMKRFVRRRQRERLREARGALLVPSEREKRLRKELKTRTLARQQETLALPLLRLDDHRRRGDRATLLEPLPLQRRPPRISSQTHTKVQCVPFSRFEKMVAQEARVNLSNVWVAIPVAHREVELKEDVGPRRGELSPLLVGRGRKKIKGGLQTTYDWVPAHLLQNKEDRETTSSHRGRRLLSPSVAKDILVSAEKNITNSRTSTR